MIGIRPATFAVALSAATLVAASASAATTFAPSGIGQHASVMNDIHRAQQRNNAAISHVRNNIRSTQHQTF